MKVDEPQKFREYVLEAINEVYYRSENELWYRGYYRQAAENAVKMVRIIIYCSLFKRVLMEFLNSWSLY